MTPPTVAGEKRGFRISGDGVLPVKPARRPAPAAPRRGLATILAIGASLAAAGLVATGRGDHSEQVPFVIDAPRGEVRFEEPSSRSIRAAPRLAEAR